MKDRNKSRVVLKELSRDQRLRRVIAKARKESQGSERARVEKVTDLFLVALTIASRFSKRKKARAMDDLADMVYLLVQASLLLKENIFDRPEVKEFFNKSSRRLYSWAEQCVAMILPKTEELRTPASAVRARNRVKAPKRVPVRPLVSS